MKIKILGPLLLFRLEATLRDYDYGISIRNYGITELSYLSVTFRNWMLLTSVALFTNCLLYDLDFGWKFKNNFNKILIISVIIYN